jgi:hypothetical protein
MTSLTTNRRQIKQAQAKQDREQHINNSIAAADHYTTDDRAIAETWEAAELFAAFIAEEL